MTTEIQKNAERIGMVFIFCFIVNFFLLVVPGNGLTRINTPPPVAGREPIATHNEPDPLLEPRTLLIGLGDSLTHGTMDATNNATNTLNAYLQKIAESLGQVTPLAFSQPLFDEQGNRLMPFRIPTNLGVDGADIFSIEGIEYYKRVGADESYLTDSYLCDKLLPSQLDDKYDKVLYPIDLLARQPVSQIDSAIWLLNQRAVKVPQGKNLVIFWMGNNDSSLAALGSGGANPTFMPLPLDQVEPELKPLLSHLLRLGESEGDISFAPYTQAAIERNLTELQEFVEQYERIINRLQIEVSPSAQVELFLLTLPYYSAVGYLFDSEDLEYYFQKLNPAYTVPPTFKRVAPPGEPITEPLKGERISLLTFGLMYALLDTGYSVDYVNQILEMDGQQQDGLVLSEEEQQSIMSRIDGFNEEIKDAVAAHGPHVHLIDIGQYMNDGLTGKTPIIIGDRELSRKWVRGSSFSLDGVHPGYTAQALVANFVLEELNAVLGLGAPLYDLSAILPQDVYIDQDEDGWAPGPDYVASGITELLFLFKDPDDGNAAVQVELPPDVWELISDVLLKEILGIPRLREEAERLGIVSAGTTGGKGGAAPPQARLPADSAGFQLMQNHPNPFNPETWIPYALGKTERVVIQIYDAKGALVRTLDMGLKGAGVYSSKDKAAYWDGTNANGERVSSGVYYYRIEAGSFQQTRKTIILK